MSFTGSPQVGREIAAQAGRNLRPVTLELGGKSPNIVFADADIDRAVVGALAGIFGATGQTCVAGSRLLVQRPVYDQMVERLAERAKQIVLGDPRDAATEMGTAANEPQFKRILDFIESAKTEGARLVAGGGAAREGALANGFFVQPTIFADVRNDMRVAQEEIFGPVLSIIPFDDEAEAVALGNASTYGLAAGVWTRDITRAMRMIHAMRTGVVWVNTYRVVAAQGAVRRGQGLRLRPRARRARADGVHHDQERDDRLLRRGPRPVRHQDMSRRTAADALSIPEPR